MVADVPRDPDNSWVETSPDALPTTNWVRSFNDTDLARLVDEALFANTDVRIAQARYEAALAAADIAAADLFPSVSGSAGFRQQENFNPVVPDLVNYNLGISASWEADLFGRIRDGADASDLDAAAIQADFAAARLAVASQVAQTWFNLSLIHI